MSHISVLVAGPEARQRWSYVPALPFVTIQVDDFAAMKLALRKFQPDAVLLDLAVLSFAGTEALRMLQSYSATTRIIILVPAHEPREELSAMKFGARGYICSDVRPEMLGRAVQRVCSGELWFTRRALESVVDHVLRRPETRLSETAEAWLQPLTAREREIVQLLRTGATNKQMASTMKVGVPTVKAHLTNIFRKVGVTDRTQLALLNAARHDSFEVVQSS